MTSVVDILTCFTTLLCTVLLLRAYARTRGKLLLWSGLCFAGLTISNLLTIADLMVFPQVDLFTWRVAAAALSMALLVYGLIWESE